MANLHEEISPITIKKIERSLARVGGKSYIVGGAVRDEIMPNTPPSKDVDFLVTGIPLAKIATALKHLGKVSEVGKSFGVVTATIDGEDFDFAIPRTKEVKTGTKHTDFEVQTDHNASVESDLARRDLTINAIAKTPNGKYIDMFGGIEDIKNKIIRAVGNPHDRFKEDPLRMLRAIQFATRFGFTIEPNTANAIKQNIGLLASISGERILLEFKKAWTKGEKNVIIMVKLLKDLGLGTMLFGDDFNPVPVQAKQDAVITNFISFFLNGGNYSRLKPTNTMITYLNTAKKLMHGERTWNLGSNIRKMLPVIIDVFLQFYDSAIIQTGKNLQMVQDLPLTAKELAVSGRDLMQLGFKNKNIGVALKKVLFAIHNSEIINNKEQIVSFLKGERVNESYNISWINFFNRVQ